MNNKAFTLVELIAIIVVLAAIFLVSFPTFINMTKSNEEKKYTQMVEDLCLAGETYIYSNTEDFEELSTSSSTIEIAIQTLFNDKYVNKNLKNSNTKQSIKDDYLSYTVLGDKSLYCEYKSNNIIITIPTGLIPIIYNGSNWEVADTSKEWYNYSNQEWANAALLNDNVSKTPGTQLTDLNNQVKAMFVYIPRYEYRIQGAYGKGGTSFSSPGEIEVNFIPKGQKKSSSGYIVHPAFTFGDEELAGIWVGKFELSHAVYFNSFGNYTEDLERYNDETSTYKYHSYDILNKDGITCNSTSCETASSLRILPNMISLRRFSASSFFYSVRAMSAEDNSFGLENADTHVIKNSEWGAVAYLSQSKYGKYGNRKYTGTNKEIYVNNSSLIITGRSAGNTGDTTIVDEVGVGHSPEGSYTYDTMENNYGIGASTTGNITGIYDMSGGGSEFVMALLKKKYPSDYSNKTVNQGLFCSNITNNQISQDYLLECLPNSKYYDYYLDTNFSENSIVIDKDEGHSLSELNFYIDTVFIERNPEQKVNILNGNLTWTWYNDSRYFINDNHRIGPWLTRGGGFAGNYALDERRQSDSGIFAGGEWFLLNSQTGSRISTRVVLVSD